MNRSGMPSLWVVWNDPDRQPAAAAEWKRSEREAAGEWEAAGERAVRRRGGEFGGRRGGGVWERTVGARHGDVGRRGPIAVLPARMASLHRAPRKAGAVVKVVTVRPPAELRKPLKKNKLR